MDTTCIDLFPLYQKIVRLRDRTSEFAYEATIRGRTESGRVISPAVLFRTAEAQNALAQLDFRARSIAVGRAAPFLRESFLFVNCHGDSLQSGCVFDDAERLEVPLHRLVLEITEQTRIQDVKGVAKMLQAYRDRGLRVALDDFGAGYSNFALVEAFAPDYIKLDRSITATVDTSVQACRVVEGMIAFSERARTTIIAEGIERASQFEVLKALGIEYGQGFYLGYPFPCKSAWGERGVVT